MALPISAIDQLRRPSKTPGWSGRLMMFSLTLLFISVIAFLGLQFGYRPYLEGKIENHQRDAKKFAQEIPESLQIQIIQFYSQLTNIKKLLANHSSASNLFALLENKTLSNVYFDRLSLNGATRELQLSGKARTMQDVGIELQVLQADPAVQRMVIKTISADPAGFWNFDISIFLAPSLFTPNAPAAVSDAITPAATASSSTR